MELPTAPKTEAEKLDEKNVNIKDVLERPGTRLILPDEEGAIERGEEPRTKEFNVFRSSGSSRTVNPHEIGADSFGRVFANELAQTALIKKSPKFPEGSIFVREKYLQETNTVPETVTAMVKREKGFSKKTGDWEYFTFTGLDLKLQKRETKSDCSKCHANAKENDFVFKYYLK